jgi:hypothetical protein
MKEQLIDEPGQEASQKLEHLLSYLKNAIRYIGAEIKRNKIFSVAVRVAALLFSGSATILLGLQVSKEYKGSLTNLAFTFSVVLTMLNTLEPFFNFRSFWVEHEAANARFNKLEDRIRFYQRGKAPAEIKEESVTSFYEEYEKIWDDLNESWYRERRNAQLKINADEPLDHRKKG